MLATLSGRTHEVAVAADGRLSRASRARRSRAFSRRRPAPAPIVCCSRASPAADDASSPRSRQRHLPCSLVACLVWRRRAQLRCTHGALAARPGDRHPADRTRVSRGRSRSRDLQQGWTAQTAEILQPEASHCVIYCPVAIPNASQMSAHARARRLVHRQTRSSLAASRLGPWKGHLDLIRALSRLSSRPWTLWIAGGAERPHERAYLSSIVADVRNLGVESRVKLLGERRDVRSLLAGADCWRRRTLNRSRSA
jgi:glycosyltransferase involved in cell wall biosynthesis